mgnify:CR=1 FL=1
MNTVQIQKDVSLIKEMIERTRQSAAESGYLLIFIGVFTALGTTLIGILEILDHHRFIMTAILGMAVINALIGFAIAVREEKKSEVTTYAKTIFWQTWLACGLSAVLIVFVFPYLGIYSMKAVPVIVSLLLGIAVYMTGTIFELRFIRMSSLIWLAAAILMAVISHPLSFLIMVAAILFGWILPGFRLHKKYKRGS